MRDLLVYGVGELGRLFGGAALRAGIRVTPITREVAAEDAMRGVPRDTPILVAVGESALEPVLASLPSERKRSVLLLQNELFPTQWRRHAVEPTVLVPWLLKKKGQPELTARPTQVYGQHATLICELHDVLGLPCRELADEGALHQALVDKYTFILTINALGLVRDRTLGVWLQEDPQRVEALAREAAKLGAALCGAGCEEQASVVATREAMQALATISARGRTAHERVERALGHAARLGVSTPKLAVCVDAQAGAR